jgi:hypothetical protein
VSHRAILKLVFDLTRRDICLDREESAGRPPALAFLWKFYFPQEHARRQQARAVLSSPAVTNSRRAFISAVLSALALLASTRVQASDGDEIQPPFHLQWGESALRLEEALLGTSAKIAERNKAKGGREIWMVEGLPGIALQRVNIHLREGKLVEVELQYRKDDWTPATYEEFMQSVRRRLEEKHGPGKPITRQQESERGVMKTLVGYRWETGGSALDLYYFAAQDPKNVFRTLSLHYKAPARSESTGASQP